MKDEKASWCYEGDFEIGDDIYTKYSCSNCGMWSEILYHYCPECHKEMDYWSWENEEDDFY